MQRFMLVYGAIAGTVVIGFMIVLLSLGAGSGEHSTPSVLIGYLIMLVALSLIFVGIKRYRDRELGGVIKFGTAAKLGLGITLVASVVYVAGWEVHQSLTDYAFIGQYTEAVIAGKKAEGVSGAELDELVAEMEVMKQRYASPLFRMPMTFLEIFPVGLVITLFAAGLLRNSRFLPATT